MAVMVSLTTNSQCMRKSLMPLGQESSPHPHMYTAWAHLPTLSTRNPPSAPRSSSRSTRQPSSSAPIHSRLRREGGGHRQGDLARGPWQGREWLAVAPNCVSAAHAARSLAHLPRKAGGRWLAATSSRWISRCPGGGPGGASCWAAGRIGGRVSSRRTPSKVGWL